MRILFADVHGGYTDSFIGGEHEYWFPPPDADRPGRSVPDPGPDGSGRPPNAREIERARLTEDPPDLMVLQRLEDVALFEELTGRRPGRDLPAIFLEHNIPKADVPHSVHPFADRPDVLIVHVTHFNAVFWDCRSAPTMIVEHGVADPGLRYTGERRGAGLRGQRTGPALADDGHGSAAGLRGRSRSTHSASTPTGCPPDSEGRVPELRTPATSVPANCMRRPGRAPGLPASEPVDVARPVADPGHDARSAGAWCWTRPKPPARCRPARARCPPMSPSCGRSAQLLLDDPVEAARRGLVAREAALERYGLPRFLADWDRAFDRALELVGRR